MVSLFKILGKFCNLSGTIGAKVGAVDIVTVRIRKGVSSNIYVNQRNFVFEVKGRSYAACLHTYVGRMKG